MTKIYAQGNYIVIEANNERNTFPKRDVRFKVVDEDGIYSLSSQELPIGDFNYSEVKKEDGSDYATSLEFETFLFENTGNFNSGADSSPNYNDYSIDEIQVGRFIYRNIGGDKVSKPKYRKVINSDIVNGTSDIDISNLNIDKVLASTDGIFRDADNFLNSKQNSTTTYSNPIIETNYLCWSVGLEDFIVGVYTGIVIHDISTNTVTLNHGTVYTKFELILEYTKTTDAETIIEPVI